MITTSTDLEVATAFERYVLDRATPLMPSSSTTAVIDLIGVDSTSVAVGAATATAPVSIGVIDALGGCGGSTVSVDDIRPLLFGAAWKVLDLSIELTLANSGIPGNKGKSGEYTIGFKVDQIHNGQPLKLHPIDSQQPLWKRILLSYAATDELRGSLVHRQLTVDPVSGEMQGTPRPGKPPMHPLTSDEQTAFCRLATGVATAVFSGQLSSREVAQMAWLSNQLAQHHRQSPLVTSEVQGLVPLVRVHGAEQQSGEIRIDVPDIARRARTAVHGPAHFDLEICLVDGRRLAAPLETCPLETVIFLQTDPPRWLDWK